MNRVVVTGVGALSSLGAGAQSHFDSAIRGISGIRPLAFDSGASIQTSIAATIEQPVPDLLNRNVTNMFDRVSHIAWNAVREALSEANLPDYEEGDLLRSGIFWGTGFGGSETVEKGFQDLYLRGKSRVHPFTIISAMPNGPSALISLQTKFTGPSITYSTACASSAHAVGEAYRQIKFGFCDRAIAGGSEAMIHPGFVVAWEALRTLANIDSENPKSSCKPFSVNRSGFVLGEGGAALVLESYESAKVRGANILAEIVGYGTSTDAVHITKPDPKGQSNAILMALNDAQIDPAEIKYINAHGTATTVGDLAEIESIKIAFKEHAKRLAISSTKAIHGHTFGAAGALELIITLLAQKNNIAPPTAFLEDQDPQCDLDCIPIKARELDMPYVMSNSFAFGGSNVSLILKRFD